MLDTLTQMSVCVNYPLIWCSAIGAGTFRPIRVSGSNAVRGESDARAVVLQDNFSVRAHAVLADVFPDERSSTYTVHQYRLGHIHLNIVVRGCRSSRTVRQKESEI